MCASRRTWSIALVVQALVAGLTGGGAIAGAQTLSDVQPGDRVRLRAPMIARGRLTGNVARTTGVTIVVLRKGGDELTVPVSALTEMEVSRGISSARGVVKGALWGGGTGLALGALVAATTKSEDYYAPMGDGETIALLTIAGAVIGVPIGALVGSERWDRLPLSPQIAVAPLHRGFGVAFSLHLWAREYESR